MDNIVTYVEKNLEPITLENFTSVDSLILSWMSYLHFPDTCKHIRNWTGIRFSELFRAEYFPSMFHGIWDPESTQHLFTAMAASPRYRNIQILGFTEDTDETTEKQFAAVTFHLAEDLCYISFRGTDSTLIGWKEDFNMAFQCPVPSQESAASYLNEAAKYCSGYIKIGGHSKGGNLAVYAAANCEETIRQRIHKIYSHDGPGFLEHVLHTESFSSINSKIEKTLPQSSLVGMLLEQQEDFYIVKSNRLSVWQHDPFSWEIDEKNFCYLQQLTPDARYLNRTLHLWISKLSIEERERFVDALFTVLTDNDAQTWRELLADWQKNFPSTVNALTRLTPEAKKFLLQTIKELLTLSIKCFPDIFRGDYSVPQN